jgi:hypothetical protein
MAAISQVSFPNGSRLNCRAKPRPEKRPRSWKGIIPFARKKRRPADGSGDPLSRTSSLGLFSPLKIGRIEGLLLTYLHRQGGVLVFSIRPLSGSLSSNSQLASPIEAHPSPFLSMSAGISSSLSPRISKRPWIGISENRSDVGAGRGEIRDPEPSSETGSKGGLFSESRSAPFSPEDGGGCGCERDHLPLDSTFQGLEGLGEALTWDSRSKMLAPRRWRM